MPAFRLKVEELYELAMARDAVTADALCSFEREAPHIIRKRLRAMLQEQEDFRKFAHLNPNHIQLTDSADFTRLDCPALNFASGAVLDFNIQSTNSQKGWLVSSFQFHLSLPSARKIGMLLFHLEEQPQRDPVRVPRCHLHINGSQAHIPFPAMSPLLILHLICNEIEPDSGLDA